MISKTIVISFLVTLCSWNIAGVVAGEENFICSQATRIFPDGDAVFSTNHAYPDTLENFDAPCFNSIADPVNASAWWYVISGNGGVLEVDTFSNFTNFDTVISVYRGDCKNLECVGRNDDSGIDSSSLVAWKTEPSVDYYVRVFGFVGTTGDFRLEARSIDPLMNDLCDEAIALTTASEFPILGTTNNTLPDTVMCDGQLYEFGNGIWYSIVGTGGALAVSACSDEYYLPSIFIFSGSCQELECLARGVNVSSVCDQWGMQAIFSTELNEQYFILVAQSEYLDFAAEFQLTVSDIAIPPNAFCSGGTQLLPSTDPTIGSLANATTMANSTPCGYSSDDRGVWYSMMGTGDVFIISTCSVELSFDSAITVTSGSCDNQECVTSASYNVWDCDLTPYLAAKAIFKSEVGTQYNIAVQQSYGGSGDDFGITVTTVKVPPNIVCSNALEVQPDNGTVTGLVQNVTGVMDDSFSLPYQTVGVWFTLVGTGDEFEITTCSSKLNFDSAIHILTGECENLKLVMSSFNDDYDCNETPYQAARAVLFTEPGVHYRILLEAVGELTDDDQGEYGLTISTVDVRPTHVCSGATVIQLSNSTIQGSLADASKFSGMNYDCTPSDDAPSAWYSLQGTGGTYAISTCSRQLNFDSVISVSSGSCQDQQCTMYNSSIDQDCSDTEYEASRVVVPTEIGVEYWIAIQGLSLQNASQGQFGLTISSVLPSPDALQDNDRLDVFSSASNVANDTISQSSASMVANVSANAGAENASVSEEDLPMSGTDQQDLLPSILLPISVAILPWMINLWSS